MTFARSARSDKMPREERPMPGGFAAAQAPRPPSDPNPRPARPGRPCSATSAVVAEKPSERRSEPSEQRPEPEPAPPEKASCHNDAASPAKQTFAEKLPKIERQARLSTFCKRLDAASSPQERLKVTARMLKMLTPKDLEELAQQSCADERKAARMAVGYIGDDDISWTNVQNLLRSGNPFVKDILDMEGGTYLTWKSLHHMKQYGDLSVSSLADQNPAAYVLALHFDACMAAAHEVLSAMGPAPRVIEEPPLWPVESELDGLQAAVLEATRWGRTALVLCSGFAHEVDSYFAARDSVAIDARRILEGKPVAEIQQELHALMIKALISGRPLRFVMRDTAVPFRGTYCHDKLFPKEVFNNKKFTLLQEEGRRLFTPGDPVAETKLCISRARPECYSFVTTDLNVKTAKERLSSGFPFFDDMAIVEVVRR